jgi:hypothetical protein
MVADDTLTSPAIAVVRVGADRSVTRLLVAPGRPFGALGNGDGLPLFAGETPSDFFTGALALASDGTLLFAGDPAHGHGLRALVAPGSTRPRIAPTQQAFATIESGRVGFTTGAAGTIAATIERSGAVVSEGRAGAAQAGSGEVTLAPPPPPGR